MPLTTSRDRRRGRREEVLCPLEAAGPRVLASMNPRVLPPKVLGALQPAAKDPPTGRSGGRRAGAPPDGKRVRATSLPNAFLRQLSSPTRAKPLASWSAASCCCCEASAHNTQYKGTDYCVYACAVHCALCCAARCTLCCTRAPLSHIRTILRLMMLMLMLMLMEMLMLGEGGPC